MNWSALAYEQQEQGLDAAQGYFRFFKEGGTYQRLVAAGGFIYKEGYRVPIEGMPDGFQKERMIQAVQFRNKLYIATGSGLVSYDGETASVVEPYAPEPLEALYIGTNGLSDTPSDFMQNGTSLVPRLDGVTFNKRYAVSNEDFIRMTAWVSKPLDMDLEYKFERRKTSDKEGYWFTSQDWSTQDFNEFSTDWEGELQFRVRIREVGTELVLHEYFVPKYIVKPVRDPDDDEIPTDHIDTCNRIVLHWNRLILYGNTYQPDAIFISHLNNPAYFPIPNSLVFESMRRDPITSVLKYRDHLVVFTETSIQALFGKSPQDYERVVQNTDTGCIAPESAMLVENHVFFLSREGVKILKTLAMDENKANVDDLDDLIEPLVYKDKNACATVHDNQYHLVFPDRKKRLRYYYRRRIWTQDESDQLDFVEMHTWDGRMYGLRRNSKVIESDKEVYDDVGHVFTTYIETKNYDFNEPYHMKKPKEIQIIMGSENYRTEFSLDVTLEGKPIIDTDVSRPYINENGNVMWKEEFDPNKTTRGSALFGNWHFGESYFGEVFTNVYKDRLFNRGRNIKTVIQHQEPYPLQLLGIGLIFKVKSP